MIQKINAITISTQQELDKLTVTRVYDIRDMLPARGKTGEEAVEQLAHAMTTAIETRQLARSRWKP